MKQTINFYDFEQAFRAADRFDQFSYQGLRLLFEYLEEYEDSTGEEIELDVIALCCEFYESDSEEIIDNYSLDIDVDDIGATDQVAEYLHENTLYAGTTSEGNHVYVSF